MLAIGTGLLARKRYLSQGMVPLRKSTQSGYPVSTADIPAMSNRICFTLIDSTITNCKKCKESRDFTQHKNAPIILASFLPTSPGAGRVCFRQNAYINSIGAGSLTRTGFNSQILGSTPKIRIERLGSTPRIRIEILGSTPKIHRFSRTILPSRRIIRSIVRNHAIFSMHKPHRSASLPPSFPFLPLLPGFVIVGLSSRVHRVFMSTQKNLSNRSGRSDSIVKWLKLIHQFT